MLNTVNNFLNLMKGQRNKLYLSFFLNFVDGILIMLPLILTYYMVAAMPEFNKNSLKRLDEQTVMLYISVMAVVIVFMPPCICVQVQATRHYVKNVFL